jgi:hypothetical protein
MGVVLPGLHPDSHALAPPHTSRCWAHGSDLWFCPGPDHVTTLWVKMSSPWQWPMVLSRTWWCHNLVGQDVEPMAVTYGSVQDLVMSQPCGSRCRAHGSDLWFCPGPDDVTTLWVKMSSPWQWPVVLSRTWWCLNLVGQDVEPMAVTYGSVQDLTMSQPSGSKMSSPWQWPMVLSRTWPCHNLGQDVEPMAVTYGSVQDLMMSQPCGSRCWAHFALGVWLSSLPSLTDQSWIDCWDGIIRWPADAQHISPHHKDHRSRTGPIFPSQ